MIPNQQWRLASAIAYFHYWTFGIDNWNANEHIISRNIWNWTGEWGSEQEANRIRTALVMYSCKYGNDVHMEATLGNCIHSQLNVWIFEVDNIRQISVTNIGNKKSNCSISRERKVCEKELSLDLRCESITIKTKLLHFWGLWLLMKISSNL